jgi:hypothetical protein
LRIKYYSFCKFVNCVKIGILLTMYTIEKLSTFSEIHLIISYWCKEEQGFEILDLEVLS